MTARPALADSLLHTAASRREQAPLRILIAALFAGAFIWRLNTGWMWGWLAAYAAGQTLEVWALWPFRPDRPTPSRVRAWIGVASIAFLSLAWGLLSLFMWRVGGFVGPAAAVLMLTSGVMNVLANTRGCPPAFLAGAAPYVLLVLILPLSWSEAAAVSLKPAFFAAAFLFAGAVMLIWRESERIIRRERAHLQAIEDGRAKAVAADEARRRFVAMVSHELRTPLGAILAGSATLQARAKTDDARDSAALIADSSRMMRRLLDDLLDLSKIEADRMSVEAVAFDPRAVVADAARLWAQPAAAKGVVLSVDGAAGLPAGVIGDPLRLSQVLANLLSNAVKFTATGEVRLRCALEASGPGRARLTLEVLDTGRGLEADELRDLFTPFAQTEQSDARLHGGTGLGLHISRELARLMGGDLHAAAREDRTGARMTLTLDLPLAEPASGASPDDAPSLSPAVTGEGLRVLVVDDHAMSRRALRLMLEAAEAQVAEAPGGDAALAQLAVEPFDLVLTDMRMPGMDGRELARRLRGSGGPNSTVALLGVSGEEDDPAVGRAAGLDGWVAKPVESEALFTAMDAALRPRCELRAAV